MHFVLSLQLSKLQTGTEDINNISMMDVTYAAKKRYSINRLLMKRGYFKELKHKTSDLFTLEQFHGVAMCSFDVFSKNL